MIALNNKVKFELLPEDRQPKPTVLNPNADALKLAIVLSVGHKVENIKEGDTITLYNNDVMIFEDKIGYCVDSNPIFINDRPQPNKTNILPEKATTISKFSKATVLSSTDKNLNAGDKVGYKDGNGLKLPDESLIVSDTQIFFKL